MFKSALGGHHVSLGKPEAYTAEAPSEVCPVVRLNLRVLRVRDGGEGFEVRWVEQRVLQGVDVNPVVLRLQSIVIHLDAMRRRSHDKLHNSQVVATVLPRRNFELLRLRENLFSRVTS